MFSDSFSAIMALVVMNFAGTLIMFLFMLRSLEATQKSISDLKANMQMRLVDIEQRMAELSFVMQNMASHTANSAASPGRSWVAPSPRQDPGALLVEDTLQQMLESRPSGNFFPDGKLPEPRQEPELVFGKTGAAGPLEIKLG